MTLLTSEVLFHVNNSEKWNPWKRELFLLLLAINVIFTQQEMKRFFTGSIYFSFSFFFHDRPK